MIEKLIAFSLRNRLFILLLSLLLIGLGINAIKEIPIDAFPDVTNIQVLVISEVPGRSPVEVERFVTFPIEVTMSGLTRLTELRSLSRFGLSVVTIVFEDEVDIYFARQLVLERLIEAKEKLPKDVEPVLGPVTTGLGEIYQYTVEGTQSLMDLRTLQDWTIRPLLKTVPGVADVSSFGGFVKQYQVLADPDKLLRHNLTLREVFEAVAENNANAGGGFLTHGSEQYIVRGIGLIQTREDIESIIVKEQNGTPIFVRDIGEVIEGHEVRQGAMVKEGKGEVVGGIVLMTRGSSGRDVTRRVKDMVAKIIHDGILPAGVKVIPFYDRTELVQRAIHTMTRAFEEGAFLVFLVILLFLWSIRGSIVIISTFLLAAFSTFFLMMGFGLSANLMTLGGLAISIGLIVDAAVIQVENVQRHLSHGGNSKQHSHTILLAVSEVRKPSIFGELIIAITFLPLITLQGIEGKMFSPLALTISFALFSALLLSIFVTPVLCSLLLKSGTEKESVLMKKMKKIYLPLLQYAMGHGKMVLSIAVVLFLLSLSLVPFLGTEFIPILDEGSLTPQVFRLPEISLEASIDIEKIVQKTLMKFPEVETVVSKIGTAEIATDPMGPNVSDPFVILKPRREWVTAERKEDLVEKIREELEKIPGVSYNITQPIALRVDELISGVKSQIAIKIFGEEMEVLKTTGSEIAEVLSNVRGVTDLRVEQVSGQPYLTLEIEREKIARYGINVADIQEIIETAVGGKVATEVFEGEKRFGVLVRFPEEKRNDLESIGNIFIPSANDSRVPLSQLAKFSFVEGPVQITRENVKRRIVVECNVKGRDIGSFVVEAEKKIRERVNLPSGYYITWGGAFENQQRAMRRLALIVPFTIALIFFLLYSSFGSLRHALLVILNLPFALIGGILGLFLSGLYLSVPASVGFIALFGVAVLNGLVLVSFIRKLEEEGIELKEAILKGCELRLRPVMMTALVAVLGLVPLLFATGPGSEIQRPLATVVIGGLFTSTLLTLLLLPTLYAWIEKPRVEPEM